MIKRHIYTQEEIDWLREHVKGQTRLQTAVQFVDHFKLDIDPTCAVQAMKYRKISSGIYGRFKPGHVPANKGKKLTPALYEKAKQGMFKPGNKPANTEPIGTERRMSDGYIWVKIDDKPKVKKQENWKQKHRHIYEQHYGPIDPKDRIVFLDQDKNNFDINNLYKLTEGELMTMNKKQRWSEDQDISMAGIAVTKLQQAANKREKEIRSNK